MTVQEFEDLCEEASLKMGMVYEIYKSLCENDFELTTLSEIVCEEIVRHH